MSLLVTLSEALNELQKKYVDEHLAGDYDESKAHSDLFDRYGSTNNRIVIPLEKTKGIADKEVQRHLAKNGWFIHNYTSGLAGRYVADRDGNKKLQLKSIGKILQQTGGDGINHSQLNDRLIKDKETGKPVVGKDGRYISEKVPQSLLHFYNNDPTRDSSNHEMNMVVSRGLHDYTGMSSGRCWESDSCMRLPHSSIGVEDVSNHLKIKNDLGHNNLIAYAVKKGDDDIERPVARVLLKRFISHDGSHSIYRMQESAANYGNPPANFRDTVKRFAEDNWPQKPDLEYSLDVGQYNDGGGSPVIKSIGHDQNGLHTSTIAGNTIKQHFKNGRLHDYVDENGVHQPAYEQTNPYGDIITKHYKDGVEHNDNGASTYIRNADGSEYFEHRIEGELHNPNGASRLLKLNGNSKTRIFGNEYTKLEEHHIDGMLHREDDLPASDVNDVNKGRSTSYNLHGLLHTNGKHPSLTVDTPKHGIKTVQYHQFGELHSPDGIIPSEHHVDTSGKYNNVEIKKWHKNGILTRPDKLPSSIEEFRGMTTESWTNEKGEEHQPEIGVPSSTAESENGYKKHIFKRNGEFVTDGTPSIILHSHGDVITKYHHPDGGSYTHTKHSNGDVKESWENAKGHMAILKTIKDKHPEISFNDGGIQSTIKTLDNGDKVLSSSDGDNYTFTKKGRIKKDGKFIDKDKQSFEWDIHSDLIGSIIHKASANPHVGEHYKALYRML